VKRLKKVGLLSSLTVFSLSSALCFAAILNQASPGQVGLAVAFGLAFAVIAFLSWRSLRGIDREEQMQKQREHYEARLARWEKEGYDVSEFKDKWLE
jgi:hypothetical protein